MADKLQRRTVDAVTFDMAGTLVRFRYQFDRDGHPALPVGWREQIREWRAAAVYRPLVEFLRVAGVADPDAVREEIAGREAATMELFPDALETLRFLRGRDFKTGLVSNISSSSKPYVRALRRLGVLEFLDAAVFSQDIEIRKPDPRIFRHLLQKIRVEPARAVHVGDQRTRDVQGATAAGMAAVLVDPGLHPMDRGDAPQPEHTVCCLRELVDLFS